MGGREGLGAFFFLFEKSFSFVVARVGNDAKRVQSALCTMDENCFPCNPTWAQDVCVHR